MMRSTLGMCVVLLCGSSMALGAGLDDLASVADRISHRASSHDRTGGNADSLSGFPPGERHVMLDTDGPGQITHIWLTVAPFGNHTAFLRDLVIRMYWENSTVPAVEAPLGDFFALGHGKTYTVRSIPIAVGINTKALNCYWPMPFYKHAKIEIHNSGGRSIRAIYYNVDYELGPILPGEGLFHAQFRRDKELRSQKHENNTTGKDNYVILDTAGRGQYVGCALFVDAQPGGWWGEGDEMIFIDGAKKPSIIGTGSEDYFCNAWGYGQSFSYPFYGAPLLDNRPEGGKFTTVYRWHIPDPVRFNKHIRVTIEHLFRGNVVNDYSSMAYWYQTEPVRQREPLPPAAENQPRCYDVKESRKTIGVDGTELEASLRSRGVDARAVRASYQNYQNGGWLRIATQGREIEATITVPEDGTYRLEVKPVNEIIEGTIRLGPRGGKMQTIAKHDGPQNKVPYVDLGEIRSRNGVIAFVIGGDPVVGIDHTRVHKIAP